MAEHLPALQFRDQVSSNSFQVVRYGAWPQPESRDAGLLPFLAQIAKLGWSPHEGQSIALVGGAVQIVQARLAILGLAAAIVHEDDEVCEHVYGVAASTGRHLFGADLADDRRGVVGVSRSDINDIGGLGGEAVGDAGVGEGGDRRLPLWWARA